MSDLDFFEHDDNFEALDVDKIDPTSNNFGADEFVSSLVSGEGSAFDVSALAQVTGDGSETAEVTGETGALTHGLVSSETYEVNWVQTEKGVFAHLEDGSLLAKGDDDSIIRIQADGAVDVQHADGTVDHWNAEGELIGTDEQVFYWTVSQEPSGGETQEAGAETEGVYGNSYAWHDDWFYQQVDGFCGPTSVAIIANEFYGSYTFDPEFLAYQAEALGLTPDISLGMPPESIELLLEAQGIPAELVNSNMTELAQCLSGGHGVIAMVDGGEIWGEDVEEYFEDWTSDHALVVTEIDTSKGTVTLADPGHPNGNGLQVSIEQFEDAWADSDYEMVVTHWDADDAADGDLVPGTVSSSTSDARNNFAIVNLAGPGNIK